MSQPGEIGGPVRDNPWRQCSEHRSYQGDQADEQPNAHVLPQQIEVDRLAATRARRDGTEWLLTEQRHAEAGDDSPYFSEIPLRLFGEGNR